jgi:hypothetical protein
MLYFANAAFDAALLLDYVDDAVIIVGADWCIQVLAALCAYLAALGCERGRASGSRSRCVPTIWSGCC